ncbi:hypothetical protein DSBG_4153 [Desulfosporosinus sp. BG]|nr:hypothetical protein DSBG_4153 [Desulfosporosinus sp. BG]
MRSLGPLFVTSVAWGHLFLLLKEQGTGLVWQSVLELPHDIRRKSMSRLAQRV